MSIEALNNTQEQQESNNRKEYMELAEQKRRIREIIPYLKDDPNKILAEEFGYKKNLKESWHKSLEATKGIGYEKNPGFTRIGKLGETQRVEYLGDRLESTILFNDEVLKIDISNFEKIDNTKQNNWKTETPIDVKYSGNMTPENINKLFENYNIHQNKRVRLTPEDGIQIVEKMVDSRKQDYHGIISNKEKQEFRQQQEQQADLQLFLSIISMDNEDGTTKKSESLKNYIKQEVNSEKISFKHELQLCSALVILGRSMSTQELLNKFDKENKSGDEVGGVSTLSQNEDILEYVANNPGYFVQNAPEIIDEAKKHIVPYNDEFTNIL